MRILFVNDGVGDAGGVQRYLEAVASALRGRGHELALLHVDRLRVASDSPVGGAAVHFCVADLGPDAAVSAAVNWQPGIVFSHNMRALDVERRLAAAAPVVKMMHGYFGTCIGGQKMHAFPRPVACDRRLGAACTILYLPRHCGRWSIRTLAAQYAWARTQRGIWPTYAAMVVASDHMRREYERNGVPPDCLAVNPLFAAHVPAAPAPPPAEFHALFLGRMTPLKGGDQLIRAVHAVARVTGQGIRLTMAGDGPARPAWEDLSARLGMAVEFPGWVQAARRDDLYREASVVIVPSLWPEPFGLTGLEAGAFGVPAIAFDVGGIRTWLRHGENGWLVNAHDGVRGLARVLAEARADPVALARHRASARQAAERFSLDRHVNALETLFERAARRRVA